MIAAWTPPPLFNPVTATVAEALSIWEVLAGPFGLLAFLPLIPFVRWARRGAAPALVLLLAGAVWCAATAGVAALGMLALGAALACGLIEAIGRLRSAGRLSERAGIAAVWLGLSALVFPLWWYPNWSWYGWVETSRMAVLHNLGFAYFYLRLIAWGCAVAKEPDTSRDPLETAAWLAYPPCMRLGPVLTRAVFIERLQNWNPATKIPWREVGYRGGLFLLGGALLVVTLVNKPKISVGAADFFASPETWPTEPLLRVFFYVPIQIYLMLWTYNELAMVASLLVGIPVDNNFAWLPRATSVREFWRRWHITVGDWMVRQIYIPLGGNRGFVPLHYGAVFVFCGVWHGASWSFVAWGASQALALTVQRYWDQARARVAWLRVLRGPVWVAACWLLTMLYQLATIVVFVDFEYAGTRFLPELAGRVFGWTARVS